MRPWRDAAHAGRAAAPSRRPRRRKPTQAQPSAKSTRQAPAHDRSVRRRARVVRAEPARPSFGQIYGLHATDDPLDLKSSVALVIDQDTQQVLFSKNPQAVLPIASITKLMTALVVTEAGAAAGRGADHLAGRRRHRKGQPLAPDGGHAAHARRDAAPGADVVGEPRRACAGAQLSGWPGRLRRRHERQGAAAGHERHALCRADGPVQPATSPAPTTWRGWSMRPTSTRSSASCRPRAKRRWTSASASCSSATPTAWCATRNGTSACRRPATSPKPGAAW